jgi:hypothetical protein
MGTPEWQPAGIFNLSAYYTTHESQYYSGPGSQSRPVPSLGNITANKYFLFSEEGVCMQGKGKLKDGRYVGCYSNLAWDHYEVPVPGADWNYHMPPDDYEHREGMPFSWTSEPSPPKYQAFETVAVCSSGVIPRDENGGIEIRINHDTLNNIMQAQGADNIFKVTDVGGGLCATNGIDIFLGTQWSYQEDPEYTFYWDIVKPIVGIDAASVEWRDLR